MSFGWILQSAMRIAAAMLLLTASVFAQDARGTITGRATDATGAALPNASVQVTNVATGVSVNVRTNEAGNFVVPYLMPGMYTLTVEQAGFRKFIQEQLQVRTNETVEVNPQLQVGDAKESVTVRAETPLLATAEVSMGQVVDTRRIEELPLFAGNALDLVQLAPGTVNGTDMRLRKAPFNNAPSQFSTDGAGNYNNEFTIDGVSNLYSDGTQPRVAFSPPQTAISEFKVQTSAFDATVGHTLGSIVNLVTKSGTNTIHGEAHEWLRHSMFDAPTIFQNRAGQSLPVYQDNRYGASGGGPVVIPRLYDGRNKTFWYFTWEANKFGDPNNSSTQTVPTEAMRRGDLSGLLALGPSYQIYDPATTRPDGRGGYVRDPFPNNIIPANRLDPVALAILKYYPLPNQPGTRDFRNNFFLSQKALEDYWSTIWRVDQNFSDKHRVFIRMHRDYWQEDKNHWFGNPISSGIILNRINRGLAFDDVYMFSPSFLLNFRYGITAQEFPERRTSRGFDLASVGFSPALASLVDRNLATLPNIQLGYISQLSPWESGDGSTSSAINAWVANFTKTASNHTIRFGPEFRIEDEFRNRYNLDVSPQFVFNSDYTRASDTSAVPQAGGEYASFLLGIPAGQMGRTASYAERDYYFALYAQDDWKVTRKLTLNLGLRWERETPIAERYNRAVAQFAFDQTNPIEAAARANYATSPIPEIAVDQFRIRGGLTFAGVNGNPARYWRGQSAGHFNPRFGLAYQITPKTVLRSGYGIFYGSIGVLYTNTIQTGFSATTPINASLDNGLTFVATTANPFPQGLQAPAGSTLGLRTNLGQSVTAFAPARKQPYAQRWMFGLERELPGSFVVEAAYVGNRTTRLSVSREFNGIPLAYLSRSPVRDPATIAYLGQTFPNPFYGLAAPYTKTITRSQLLRPYPQFSSVQELDPVGYAWYHALQSRIEKRFSRGVALQVSYTWSKAMEATQFLNDADPMPSEVISAIDRPHRIVGSGIWELPFGKRRRFGSKWNAVLNFIAGEWQLNGLYQKQSGAPLGFGNRIFTGTDLRSVALADDVRSVDHWLTSAGFVTSSSQQLASNVRTMPLRFSYIRGPGQERWDFSAIKNFSLTERARLQFRGECYNAFNHPNLSDPNTDPTSAAFGVITGQNPPRSWQFALKMIF